jgi:cell pole-organizing protein PopZ
MVQDGRGLIYFTNKKGVLEFDGKNWRLIATPGAVYTLSLLQDDVIMQSSNSIQKLLDAKSMMTGISNFMKTPYPIEIAVQLMEPKLEKWMNENLAQIVEKIVKEEISKIIPKQ